VSLHIPIEFVADILLVKVIADLLVESAHIVVQDRMSFFTLMTIRTDTGRSGVLCGASGPSLVWLR
jgi:hypothetical protein